MAALQVTGFDGLVHWKSSTTAQSRIGGTLPSTVSVVW